MNKQFFRTLMLSALLTLGVQSTYAQRPYEVEPISAEFKASVDQIHSLEIDDPDKAGKIYMKLMNKIKNNKDDLMSVGNYCLDNDNLQLALGCAKAIYKIRPQYIDGLAFYGETLLKMQDYGQAGTRFEEILALDENNVYAIKRSAFLYKNVNPAASLDYLDRLLEIDPNNYDVYRDKGDIYYGNQMQDYGKAVEFYGKYYDAVSANPSKLDVAACESYLNSLYAMSGQDRGNIDKMISVSEVVKGIAPNDIIPYRMYFIGKCNKIGMGTDYTAELQAATDAESYITNKQFADSVYIATDYEMAANLAKEKDQNLEAVSYLSKAISALDAKSAKAQADEENPDEAKKVVDGNNARKIGLYRQQANLYSQESKFDECFDAYAKYFALKGDKVDATDYLQIANSYTAAFNRGEEAKKEEYFKKANEYYDKTTAYEMENHRSRLLAYQRQARLNNVDNQKPIDAVRDYYLKVIEVGSEDALKDVSISIDARYEACRYLFFYYVSVEPADKENATKVATMAKELNKEGTEATIKSFFDYLQTI